jgi:uncharacterized protein DUF6402
MPRAPVEPVSSRDRAEADAFFADLLGRGRRATQAEDAPALAEDDGKPASLDFLINRHLAVKRSDVPLTSPTGTGQLRQDVVKLPNGNLAVTRLELQFRRARVDFVEFIASILDNKGWNIAAAYQRIWANGPANELQGHVRDGRGNYDPLTIETIPMKWIVKFPRARDLFVEVTDPKVFANEEARRVLRTKIDAKFAAARASSSVTFGDFTKRGRALEDEYTNQRSLTKYDGIDELTAAFGRFVLCVIPQGVATKTGKGTDVVIQKTGVFLRDSFDFNGDQDLGWWAYPDRITTNLPEKNWEDYVSVSNQTYRNYRAIYTDYRVPNQGRRYRGTAGGDFAIYSDVMIDDSRPEVRFSY